MNNQNPNFQNPNQNQNHACAACRYQRKKCSRNCPLAPYFPPDSQTRFLNAHKLFGVGNILKLIRSLPDPKQKHNAMQSMLIQSYLRAKDPVFGCVGHILNLQTQIVQHQNQLNLVLHHLASIRASSINHNCAHDVSRAHEGGNQGGFEQRESGGGFENGNFQQEFIGDENECRLMNENFDSYSGLIGENGMSNMMMMLMKQEEQDGNALIPVLEERNK